MGNNNSSRVVLTFDRLNSNFLAGELVSGSVQFEMLEQFDKVHAVYLEIVGEAGYTTEERRTITVDAKQKVEIYAKNHNVLFLKTRITVKRREAGEQNLPLVPGIIYNWPFQVQLPQHLPPTLHEVDYPYIKYYIQSVIDRPWYKRNSEWKHALSIFPDMNLQYIPDVQQLAQFSNANREEIDIQIIFPKLGYVPNETLVSTIEIKNPNQITIKHIQIFLYQHYRIQNNARTNIIFSSTIPDIQKFNDVQISKPFSFVVSSVNLPPTSNYIGGIDQAITVNVSYELRFVIKGQEPNLWDRVSGYFSSIPVKQLSSDINISVPITIGTFPHQQYSPNDGASSSAQFLLTPSAPSEEDLPPSYESLVHNSSVKTPI